MKKLERTRMARELAGLARDAQLLVQRELATETDAIEYGTGQTETLTQR